MAADHDDWRLYRIHSCSTQTIHSGTRRSSVATNEVVSQGTTYCCIERTALQCRDMTFEVFSLFPLNVACRNETWIFVIILSPPALCLLR